MFRIGSKIYVPVLVFVFVFASLALIPAAADAYDWNAADGDWSVGSNWNPAGPPTSADCVFIDNSGIVRITGDAVINNIYAGWYNSSSIVMQIGILIALTFVSIGFGPDMPGGYVGTGDIGDAGTALFEQTGGTFTSEMELYIGYKASAQGQYNLSAGNLEAAYECVGYQGVGEFNQTGGSHTADELYIGEMAGSWGEYTFTGGSLEIGALTINNGWLDIDLSEIEFFRVMGDEVNLLDGYIADGKIFDGSLNGNIWAVYDSQNDWTTLAYTAGTTVPEPGTIALLAASALGVLGAIRKTRK